jgi:hypothetical protein
MGVIGVKRYVSALALVLALSIVGCAKSATPSEADNAAAKSVVRAYWAAIAARDPRAAEKLFVTVDGTDVRDLVAKNVAYSQENTSVAVERVMRFYWLENGMLRPEADRGTVYPSEVSRLSSLSEQYAMAALITYEAISSDATRFFVVKTNGEYRLVR